MILCSNFSISKTQILKVSINCVFVDQVCETVYNLSKLSWTEHIKIVANIGNGISGVKRPDSIRQLIQALTFYDIF